MNNLCEPEDMHSQVKANSVDPAGRIYCQALPMTNGIKGYSRMSACTVHKKHRSQRWQHKFSHSGVVRGGQDTGRKAKAIRKHLSGYTVPALCAAAERGHTEESTNLVHHSDIELLDVGDMNGGLCWGWEGQAQVMDHDS